MTGLFSTITSEFNLAPFKITSALPAANTIVRSETDPLAREAVGLPARESGILGRELSVDLRDSSFHPFARESENPVDVN